MLNSNAQKDSRLVRTAGLVDAGGGLVGLAAATNTAVADRAVTVSIDADIPDAAGLAAALVIGVELIVVARAWEAGQDGVSTEDSDEGSGDGGETHFD